MINVILLLLLLLLGVCCALHHKIDAFGAKTDRLIKEIEALKKQGRANAPADTEAAGAPVSSLGRPDRPEEAKQTGTRGVVRESETILERPADLPSVAGKEEEAGPIPWLAKERPEEERKGETAQRDEELPPPPPIRLQPPPVPASPVVRKKVNYERYIGENLFGKIGILILVVGMGLFVKYAIDKDWIDETFRTILGFAVGGVLLFVAARLKDTYRTFSSLLAGGAFAVCYVTVAMAYHYYGLFSQTAAFIILIVLTVCMCGLAVGYDRRELATIALTGGFIAPFLVSDGMGSYLILFTYVIILDLGMFGLSLYKKWGELPVICFGFTWMVLAGYAVAADWDWMEPRQVIHLLIFSVAFYLIFSLAAAFIVRVNLRVVNQYLLGILALNNFVFLFFALWFLHEMDLATNYNGAFTLFVALVNGALFCWIRHKGEGFRFLWHTLLGLTIVFVSITIPIQLQGTFITLFWATEMVVIFWFYLRFRLPLYEFFGILLACLTFISFGMDIENLHTDSDLLAESRLFVNGTFATGIYTGLAFGVGAWLWERAQKNNGWLIAAAALVIYFSFIVDFKLYISPLVKAVSYMEGFTATVLAGMSAWLGRKRFPVGRHVGIYLLATGFSLFLFILFMYVIRWDSGAEEVTRPLLWFSWVVLAGHIGGVGRLYYAQESVWSKQSNRVICFLSFFSVVWLVVGTNNLLYQWELADEANAGFSVSLSVAGFILMALGMRLHLKVLRMVSLVTFGLVLLKLGLVDLWLLATIGKVIVFIILGVILLVLSFLYQKLKAVLFDDDPDPRKREWNL